MRRFVFILLFLPYFSCDNKKETKINKRILAQNEIPRSILNTYLQKISLPDIENGSKSLEIRKWFPFYYLDSFPVALQRIYLGDGELKGQCFLFCDKNGGLITTESELKSIKISSYQINHIRQDYLDSLIQDYNIGKIDSIDFRKIKKSNLERASTKTPRRIFLEQSDSISYNGIFMANPAMYKDLDDVGINTCNKISDFIFNLFVKSDTGFYKWFENLGQEISSKE